MDRWTRYPDVNDILRELVAQVRSLLGRRFVGMYLCGSLATGDFQPGRSDVDFVVVSDGFLPEDIVAGLDLLHHALVSNGFKWAEKLEGVYLPVGVLRRHDPTHPPVLGN